MTTKPDVLNIFPIRIYAHEYETWAETPKLAKSLWMHHAKRKMFLWYAADFRINSSTSVTLYVYEMLNSVYGGIGRQIYEEEIFEFNPEEQTLLDAYILEAQTTRAAKVFEQREAAKQEKKIPGIRKELFGV